MKFKLVAVILAVAAIFSTAFYVHAQSALGDLRGTVTDSAGAVVAGASVEAKNQETNETRTTTSNEKGEYVLSKLNVGSYTITANAQGFAGTSVRDVRVSVAFVTEQNVTIGAAGTQATVTVTSGDASTQLNATDQQLSTIITNRKINDLPLLSRDPSSLVLLSPGTVQTDTALGGFSVNGSRERNNNFIVDGVDNNDTDVPGIPGGVATPNIDATEEFRVITGNFNAEYGRNTGGIVTTATKRGANDFHGGAYIYYRSDKFAARNFFDTTGEADPLDKKQFGGSIGGPIWKNKWFFFFNYEGDRTKSGTQQYRLVPTALARTGIIQTPGLGTLDIRPNGANNGTAFIPFLGNGAALPFSPTSLALLNLFPLPNYPANGAVQSGEINGVLQGGVIPGAFELYTFGYTARDHSNSLAFRSDLKINDKHTLTFSANYGKGDFSFGAPTFDTFNDELRTPQLGGVFAFNLLSAFTSSMVNELRVGTNRIDSKFYGQGDGPVSNAINDAVRSAFTANGVPYPNFGGANASTLNLVTPFTSIANFSTQGRKTGTTTIGDSFTWLRGNHTFKFGGEGRFVYTNGDLNFSRQETLDFGLAANFAIPTVVNEAGDDFISPFGSGRIINDYLTFLSGVVVFQSQTQFFNGAGTRVDNDFRRYRTNEFGLFFQDTWKIRSDLTLNLGLRWDYATVPYEKNGLLSNLLGQDPSGPTPAGGFVFETVGKNSANPDIPLYDKDWNNFGPRVGFAYSPSFDSGWLGKVFGGPGKSSFRGGYGIFYDRVFTNLFNNVSTNPPFSRSTNILPLDANDQFITLDRLSRIPTLPATNAAFDGDELTVVLFPTSRNNILQEKFVIPSSATWNVGFQRQFGSGFLFEIDYVGTRGYHLIRDVNAQLTSIARVNALTGGNISVSPSLRTNYENGSFNTAFAPNSAFLIISTGNSEYNAMQTRVTKTLNSNRWGHGQLQAFYTWSHSIDDAPDSLVTGTSDRSLPRDSSGFTGGLFAERGDSSFDARHRFVFNAIYDIPFRFGDKWMDRLLGNWTISGIYQAQTGYPFSVFANGVDTQGTGLSARASFNSRADRLTPTLTSENARVYTGPDRSLFLGAPCAPGVISEGCTPLGVPFQGNVGRGTFRGPKFSKVDFSIIKRFPISETMRFTIRADFFNIFNTVNLNTPVSDVLDPSFGLSTKAGDARIIQFAGRFDF